MGLSKSFFRLIRTYFITGIFVLLPLVASAYLLWTAFSAADNALGRFASFILRQDEVIPGAGAVLTVLLVLLVGMFAANVVGRRIIHFFEETLFTRIPLIGSIYSAIKQLIDAFRLDTRKGFQQVVMLEWPRDGVYSLGFITNDAPALLSAETDEDVITLFIPTVPNVTTGFFVVVPRSSVQVLDVSVEDGFKMMISSGVWLPDAKDGAVRKNNEEPPPVQNVPDA